MMEVVVVTTGAIRPKRSAVYLRHGTYVVAHTADTDPSETPVKTSTSTNQQYIVYRPNERPSCHPTNSM